VVYWIQMRSVCDSYHDYIYGHNWKTDSSMGIVLGSQAIQETCASRALFVNIIPRTLGYNFCMPNDAGNGRVCEPIPGNVAAQQTADFYGAMTIAGVFFLAVGLSMKSGKTPVLTN
jgi:hypothetical protein